MKANTVIMFHGRFYIFDSHCNETHFYARRVGYEKRLVKISYNGLIRHLANIWHLNVRWVAFIIATGKRKNHEFMWFISCMSSAYNNGESISSHEDFTNFIISNVVKATV
ncbi:hypothetical protein MM5_187 [Morganella phage vB_Mm5]